jgi:gliding motility-associated protein GldE
MSALASGSEAAYFSLGPVEKELLRSQDTKSSKMVLELLNKPEELLATLLIANNFVNIAIVIVSSALINNLLPDNSSNELLRFMVEIIGITFVILLFGEVIPKIWSSKNAILMSKFMAIPISWMKLVPPLSWLNSFLVNGTKFIQRKAKKRGYKISTDELEQALALTKEESTTKEEQKILEGIIKFGNTTVDQIMKSRMEIVGLEAHTLYSDVISQIKETGYSRIPVFEKSQDNVIGIIYTKDLISNINSQDDFNWQEKIRKPLFIPNKKKIGDLLQVFQHQKMHMAIVVDEYGGTNGLITLEDVLEEIVGDITDEFDDEDVLYTRIDNTNYLFEGRTALVDFYKVLNIDGKQFEQVKGESETLGGFIIEHAGRIPMNNEFIQIDNFKFTVESSDKRRVKMIKVTIQ